MAKAKIKKAATPPSKLSRILGVMQAVDYPIPEGRLTQLNGQEVYVLPQTVHGGTNLITTWDPPAIFDSVPDALTFIRTKSNDVNSWIGAVGKKDVAVNLFTPDSYDYSRKELSEDATDQDRLEALMECFIDLWKRNGATNG